MEKFSLFTLEDRKPVPCPDTEMWARWKGDKDLSRVALTEIGDTKVSTVFVGIDMSLGQSKRPQVFETMIFEDGKATRRRRYATWEDAEAGHREMCAGVAAKK